MSMPSAASIFYYLIAEVIRSFSGSLPCDRIGPEGEVRKEFFFAILMIRHGIWPKYPLQYFFIAHLLVQAL